MRSHRLPVLFCPPGLALLLALALPRPAIALANPLRLSEAEILTQLQTLPGWTRDGQTLSCTYRLANFVESVALVQQVVPAAEAAAHHPDVAIAYNRVTFSLTTHDVGGLTALDFQVATAIARLAAAAHPPLQCES